MAIVRLAGGDRGASRWTVYDTHLGDLAGAGPTGRNLAISGVSIYRLADGKIVEGWVQDDTMQQLRAAAAPQEAPAGTP